MERHGIKDLLRDLTQELAYERPEQPVNLLHEKLGAMLGEDRGGPDAAKPNGAGSGATAPTNFLLKMHVEAAGRGGSAYKKWGLVKDALPVVGVCVAVTLDSNDRCATARVALAGLSAGAHRATAAEVFVVEPAAVTADQRRSAKAINFGLIYGMSAFGLARQLGIERGAAQRYVNLYFERYPGVKRYMDDIRAQAHEQGYVETVFGRRLYLPEINSRNVQRRQYAERTAINAPMQGTAADIIKLAMIAVDDWLLTDKVPAEIIMQVHDELVLEVEDAAVEHVKAGLRERISAAAALAVRLEVDVRDGMNWDEAH
jgi:hypothetical protein